MNFQKLLSVLLISIILVGLLSGCGSTQDTVVATKIPFQIQTRSLYNSENLGYITKSAKVQGTSEIIVSSMVSGKIKILGATLGKKVSNGSLLVQLQDSTAPGGKAIQDAQLGLARAKLTEQNTIDDIVRQQQKLRYDLNNVNEKLTGSNTSIQLAKLQKDLEKAEFDYQAKLKSDGQTSDNYLTTIQNIQSDLKLLMADTLNETDKVLGVTDVYVNDTNYRDMRVYIGAKKPELRSKAVEIFYDLKSMEDGLSIMDRKDITLKTIDQVLSTYSKIVLRMSDLFVVMKQNFIYSIDDSRYQPQINLSANLFNTLSSRASGLNSSISSQINSSRSYFVSYEDQQSSLAKQIESLRAQINLTKKSLDDVQFNATINAERSEIGFYGQTQNAFLSRESASLQLAQANFNQSKFTITSPLQGFVADVLVDLGQEVGPGTPLIKLISNQQQIETTLTTEEIKNINLGQQVTLESEIGGGRGIIAQIAQTADKSGSFKVIIVLTESTIPAGLFVTVQIPVQKGTLLLPINALSIVDTNTAVAFFWDGSQIVSKTVTISSIFGDQVEIVDKLSTNYALITTDMSNYDERTMEIVQDGELKIKN